MPTVAGTIFRGRGLEPIEGTITIEDGEIKAIDEGETSSSDIISPTFVNAHTHIGDSIAKGVGAGLSLEELVAPPDGLKHRLLRESTPADRIEAMARSLRQMASMGIDRIIDFREGGIEGVEELRKASEGIPIRELAYGRDTPDVLKVADGFGASGANDEDFSVERQRARELDKPFAIHAGEADASDIDPALDLEPDFLIHVVHPRARHLDRIGADEIPVVVCPRSNQMTNVGFPPVADLEARTTLALGTDNVMLNSPDIFREMAHLELCSPLDAKTVLKMATINGRAICGESTEGIAVGEPARLVVFDGTSDTLAGTANPHRAIVRRAGPADVNHVITDV